MKVSQNSYYKLHHLTRDSFPDLTPDQAEDIISAQERLQKDLEHDHPTPHSWIDRTTDGGYVLVAEVDNPYKVPDTYEGFTVISSGEDR